MEICIGRLVEKFKESPYVFYTEHDMHCYLYHLVYKELYERGTIEKCKTYDGEETILLHKEYPPIDKKERGRRGPFDMTVLDPVSMARILSKYHNYNLRDHNEKPASPFIAIDLALNYGTEHLLRDYRKLTNTKNEVKRGYILHFIRDIDVERRQGFSNLLKEVERIKDEGKVKIWYVNVYGDEISEIKSESW